MGVFCGFWRFGFFQGLQSYLTTFHKNYSKIPGDSSRDLFGMVKWPPTIGDEKGTLNHQVKIYFFQNFWSQVIQAVPFSSPIVGGHLTSPLERVTFFHHPKKVTAWITRLRAIFSELLKEVLFGPKKNSEKNCLASFGPGGSSHRKSHHGFTAVPKAGRSDHRISSPWEKSRRKKDLTKT